MNANRLPDKWVEELFRRFDTIWGAQKTRALFAPPDGEENVADWAEDVHNLWATQLGPYTGEVLKKALEAAIASGREWPPTLPEFKGLCREFNHAEHRPANTLPPPGQSETDRETARANLERIKQMLAGAVKRMPA